MKIIFFGTPDFAAISLQALLNWKQRQDLSNISILSVYCQPDRPSGRGHILRAGPVKKLALEHNIPVLQPQNFKDQAELERLADFKADIFVIAAYGIILPKALLDMPPLGAINVHASLLPEYRGAAPIQRAIMNGDQRTGVSIMRVEPKLDSGPILLQRPLAIGQNQTAGELHDELAALGGVLLVEALGRLFEGSLAEQPQDDRRMTYAHKLSKADGELNFSQTAMQVHNQARGVTPWPGAQLVFTRLKPDSAGHDAKDASPAQSTTQLSAQVQVIVEKGLALEGAPANSLCPVDIVPPGTVLPLQGDILPVVCAEGVYGILRLRPAGGKSMSAASFVNGYLKNCTVCISPV